MLSALKYVIGRSVTFKKANKMTRGIGGTSPANIMKHLKGFRSPLSKADILTLVRSKQEDPRYPETEAVIALLQEVLPDKEYGTIREVLQAIHRR